MVTVLINAVNYIPSTYFPCNRKCLQWENKKKIKKKELEILKKRKCLIFDHTHSIPPPPTPPVLATTYVTAFSMILFVLFIYLFILGAALTAYGGSQARGPNRVEPANLRHSHSNAESEPWL